MHHIIDGETDRILVIGDHASNHIPERLGGLGLSADDRARHIAWDIGTAELVRAVCAEFGCGGVLAGVSRLVIDMNREPEHAGLVPTTSDGTVIAANRDLDAQEMAGRREMFEGYHGTVAGTLAAHPGAMLLSLHSFTPHPLTGGRREVDVGLLAKHDADGGDWGRAEAFLAALPGHLGTGINVPYSAYDLAYTVDRHATGTAERATRPHLAVEVRQDHLGSDEQIADMVGLLVGAIRPLIPR